MKKNIIILWSLLPKKYKIETFFIAILVFLCALLEIIGIGLIIPILSALVNENASSQYSIFQNILGFFGDISRTDIVFYGMFSISIIFFLKYSILIFTYWKQSKYLWKIKFFLSKKLLNQYINYKYELFIQDNSGIFTRNIVREITNVVNMVLSPLISIFIESLLVISISAFILSKEFFGGCFLFLYLTLAIYLFQNFSKKKLKKWSENAQLHDGLKYKSLIEIFSGIKDIKLFGKENSFAKRFEKHAQNTFNAEQKNFFLSQLPRIWLEFICIFGLTIFILFLITKYGSLKDILPIVGLYAFAAFRILPLSNRILGSIQQIRFGQVSLEALIKEILKTNKNYLQKNDITNTFNHKLELKNISYSYPNSQTYALNQINLSVIKGDCVGIIGKSGCGKTTLVDIILGLLIPKSGSIIVDGKEICADTRGWQNLIGYVRQDIFLLDDTLKNNITFGIPEKNINIKNLNYAVEASQISEFVNSLPLKLDTMVGEKGVRISGGQRQRIAIARALYNKPSILIFDEATSALDSVTELEIMRSIDRIRGKSTVIMVAHRLTTLKECNVIYELDKKGIKQIKSLKF